MKNLSFQHPAAMIASAAVVGAPESEGKIGTCFDCACPDDLFGETTWENAEAKMTKLALSLAMEKAKTTPPEFILGGDLQNQCTASSYGALPYSLAYFGLYGACSTFAEGLILASVLLNGTDFRTGCVCATSHFASAERQYRFPLEYGCQRTPTAQRTVTGSGAVVLSRPAGQYDGLHIVGARPGIIRDSFVKDAGNMGAAMAPAAADTLIGFFRESGTKPEEYDLILTGDLGSVGYELCRELCKESGYALGERYLDCGCEIFYHEQDVHAGASGCGCSAVYVCGCLAKTYRERGFQNILFVGTGALLSPLTVQQKNSIPGIAHLVHLKGGTL